MKAKRLLNLSKALFTCQTRSPNLFTRVTLAPKIGDGGPDIYSVPGVCYFWDTVSNCLESPSRIAKAAGSSSYHGDFGCFCNLKQVIHSQLLSTSARLIDTNSLDV